jgi:hypothetical protein
VVSRTRAQKKKFDLRAHANDVVDTAKMLKTPLVNIHQPCDEYMRNEILNKLNSGRTRYVSDMICSIEEIPEFRNASTRIKLVHGNVRNETGRWILVLAAGRMGDIQSQNCTTNTGFLLSYTYI